MALVAVLDIVAGPGVGFLPLVSLGPAFAGLVGGWRRTALIGGLALALCALLGFYNGLLDGRRGFTAMASVAGVTGAGLAAAAMRQRREAELADVRAIAEVAQRVVLRPVPRTARHLSIAVSYTSAVSAARIGGDLYEVVVFRGGVRVIVGDVQGKGLEAVETAATVLGAFREAAHEEGGLTAVSDRLERALGREPEDEKFVTAVLAEFRDDGGVSLLNHGHPAPMLISSSGAVTFADPICYAPPLGLDWPGTAAPEPLEMHLAREDQLLFFTDGVTETRDQKGVFYPLADKAELLRAAEPHAALAALRSDLVAYAGQPLRDDAAMLLIRYRCP
ncbi:PP2C family protein-serine/threonine phosphatase [Streptomyces lavendulocolor]|uniref:PP2C family protein-serine/threonine phosphatase n=1 Tax=Streptomyces lavendulocolor TaxID=67316 RepID=UPI003C2E453B